MKNLEQGARLIHKIQAGNSFTFARDEQNIWLQTFYQLTKKKRGGRPDQVWVSRTIKQTVKESATVLYIEPERNFFLCPHREESIWCYLFFKKSNLHPLSKRRHQCTVLISYSRWCLIIYSMRTSFTNVMIWIKRTTVQLSIRVFCSAYSILHSD